MRVDGNGDEKRDKNGLPEEGEISEEELPKDTDDK